MAENIPMMLQQARQIRQGLRDSIAHAASERLREALQEELVASENSHEVLKKELERLANSLKSIRIEYKGLRTNGLDVYALVAALLSTTQAMRQMASVVKPETFDVPILDAMTSRLRQAADNCAGAYDKFLHGLIFAVKGIVLSPEDAVAAKVVWKTANNAEVIQMTWDDRNGEWRPPSDVSIEHRSIKEMVKDMNKQSEEKGGWKHGTVAWLKVERIGNKYKVSFDIEEPDYEQAKVADVLNQEHGTVHPDDVPDY